MVTRYLPLLTFMATLVALPRPIPADDTTPAKPMATIATSPADNDALLQTVEKILADIETYTLPNGLKVYLKRTTNAGIVTTMMAYKVGSADEELDQTGLSHYLEHLMFKGTDTLKPGDIDKMTQRSGGKNNAYTSEDATVYHFDFAAENWRKALEVEADRMRHLRIDAEHEFEQEKGAVIAELDRGEDEPWDVETKLILPLLMGKKSPYGHPVIGEKEHVRAADAAVIKKHYDRWYHPNNAHLIIVGDFDIKDAKTAIDELFAKIPKAELPERRPQPKWPARPETIRKPMSSKFETPRLLMGFNTVAADHPDSLVLDILQLILNEGKLGRLNRRLIDEENLAASVTVGSQGGRYPGWLSIQAEVLDSDTFDTVEDRVMAELKRIAVDGVSERELKRVRRNLMAKSIYSLESTHDQADTIARMVVLYDLDFLKTMYRKQLAVTSDDIRRVVKTYLIDRPGVIIQSKPAAKDEAEKQVKYKPATKAREPIAANNKQGNFLADLNTVTLPNGLTLLMIENHRVPVIYTEALVQDTQLREPFEQHGIAHLVGDLLQEGTTTRSANDLAEQVETLGAELKMQADGGNLKMLSGDMDIGLELFFDALMNPRFEEKAVTTKRELLSSAIDEKSTQPRSKAEALFKSLVYGNHPLGRPLFGNKDVVDNLTADDCRKWHSKLFVPNNTLVAVVGDFDAKTLVAKIEKLTAKWKAKKLPPLEEVKVAMPEKFTQQIIPDPMAAQLHMYFGHVGIKRDDPDYYALLVMDYILGTGTGFTDRLSSNLRDRQGLAYSITASITTSATTEPGAFTGYVGTFPDKFAIVKSGLLKEIRLIREEAPTQDEVDAAKGYLLGSLPLSYDSNDKIAAELLTLKQAGLEKDFVAKYREGIRAVTPERVLAVAKKHLDPDRMVLVAVGPVDEKGKPLKK